MGFPKRLENPFYLHYLHFPWRWIDASWNVKSSPREVEMIR